VQEIPWRIPVNSIKPFFHSSHCSLKSTCMLEISYRKNSYKNFGQNSYRKNSYSWVSLRHFSLNLTGGQPKMYWCLCCTGVRKWYEIARISHQTQGQHIQWTINSLWWMCLDLELTPRQIYDVIWNPRIGIPIGKIPIGILSEILIGIFPIGIFPIGIPIGKIPIGIFPTGIPIEI
jgi:hypothetical protein